jgi:molybdopterin-guanine dinucleotide biosynthesis protein A
LNPPNQNLPPPLLIPPLSIETYILAGGRSSRMGRDKSRLPLGTGVMIDYVAAAAEQAGLPCRVIDRDLVPGLGPLGGVLTALESSRCESVLFMACDMPFVTPGHLQGMASEMTRENAIFSSVGGRVGFPFALRRTLLELVRARVTEGKRSLRDLAEDSGAKQWEIPEERHLEFCNINTVEDWQRAHQQMKAG